MTSTAFNNSPRLTLLALILTGSVPAAVAQTTFSADTARVAAPTLASAAPALPAPLTLTPAPPATGAADTTETAPPPAETAAVAAAPAAAASDTVATSELRRLDEQWADAAVRNDAETMSQLMAPEYVFINSKGQIMRRPDMLSAVANGRAKTTVNKGFDYLIRVYGDVGVVMHNTSFVGSLNGQDTSGEYRATHTYVRRAGRWQLTSSQATSVAPPDSRLSPRKPGRPLSAPR